MMKCYLNAQPTTKTQRSDDLQVEFLEAQEVPIVIMGGNSGSARITFPVKKGDTVLLLYSDREYGGLLDTDGTSPVDTEERTPFGMYPIAALCGYFTRPAAKSISSDNVEIYNGSTQITVQPSGQVVIDASEAVTNCNLQVNGNITATGSVDAGTSMSAGTSVTAGSSVSAGTTVTATTTVAGLTLAATTSMTVAGTEMSGHTHSYTWTDDAGSGTTGEPI